MLIAFQCSACEQKIEADAISAGKAINCSNCGATLTVPDARISPGTIISGFKIESLLGKGGMGEVYLARQLSMDRRVALKILPPRFAANNENVQRFLKEVRMAARLEHPNIVRAYEAGEDGGVYFLAMAFVDGLTLADRLTRKGAMGDHEALRILRKTALALAYAWNEHHIIHRDIKPSNIMLDRRGETLLADLGLSKSIEDTSTTMSGSIMGTPNYMSPEQAEGHANIDFRCDIYSLGATLYHMLTGKMPFHGSSVMEVLRKQLTEPLPDPRASSPWVSEACVELLERMLAKKPEARPSSWENLITEIDAILSGTPSVKMPLSCGQSVLVRADAPTMPMSEFAPSKPSIPHNIESKPIDKEQPLEQPSRTMSVSKMTLLAVSGMIIAFAVVGMRQIRNWRGHHLKPSAPLSIGTSVVVQVFAPIPKSENPAVSKKSDVSLVINTPSPGFQNPAPLGSFAARKPGESTIVNLDGIDLELVWIPPGSFLMGSPTNEIGRSEDEILHPVTISKGFWLGKYEITQEQWKHVMATNPSRSKLSDTNHPVENVRWDETPEFVAKLNRIVPKGGFRLPTEAEWEYACRAGSTSALYNGHALLSTKGRNQPLENIAWYGENSKQRTWPVGLKTPNSWGLYDMLGNVWEWCEDRHGPYPAELVVDPSGPGPYTVTRLCRGGGYLSHAFECRSAVRHKNSPLYRWITGVRIARNATEE